MSPTTYLTNAYAYVIEIDGIDVVKNGLDVLSMSVDLSTDSHGTFSIIFSGANGPANESDWIDSELFTIGKKVSIKMGIGPNGLAKLIAGEVSNIKGNFPSDSMPSVELIGNDSSRLAISKKLGTISVVKRYGSELVSFTPEIENRSIKGVGECVGDSNIVPGITMKLEGLGQRFSRTYQLTAAKHTMNKKLGYRTIFNVIGK